MKTYFLGIFLLIASSITLASTTVDESPLGVLRLKTLTDNDLEISLSVYRPELFKSVYITESVTGDSQLVNCDVEDSVYKSRLGSSLRGKMLEFRFSPEPRVIHSFTACFIDKNGQLFSDILKVSGGLPY